MFLCSGGGTKTKDYIFVKNVRSPRTLFFLENTALLFGVKRRNERAERAELRAEVERLQRRSVGAKPRQAKPLPRTSGASGRRREATEGRRPSLTERAERASICRPSQAASNSAEEKCSLFVVSSPFWGAAMHPIGEETEKRRKRNGGRTAFLLSFVHEYGSLIAETLEVCQFYSRNT